MMHNMEKIGWKKFPQNVRNDILNEEIADYCNLVIQCVRIGIRWGYLEQSI